MQHLFLLQHSLSFSKDRAIDRSQINMWLQVYYLFYIYTVWPSKGEPISFCLFFIAMFF